MIFFRVAVEANLLLPRQSLSLFHEDRDENASSQVNAEEQEEGTWNGERVEEGLGEECHRKDTSPENHACHAISCIYGDLSGVREEVRALRSLIDSQEEHDKDEDRCVPMLLRTDCDE